MKIYVFSELGLFSGFEPGERAPRLENLGGNSSNPMNDILAKSAQAAEEAKWNKSNKLEEIKADLAYRRQQQNEYRDELKFLKNKAKIMKQMGITSMDDNGGTQGYAPTYQTPQAYTPMYAQPYPQQYGMM